MANGLINNSIITREALPLFRNTNAFLRGISRPYEAYFGDRAGPMKPGSTINVRLPNDPVVFEGVTYQSQTINERSVPLTVGTRKFVPLNFTSNERTLNVNDFSRRYIAPAVNNLVGHVAADVMSVSLGAANMVANFGSNGQVIAPVAETWLSANSTLTSYGAPMMGRHAILDPSTNASTISGLAGLFNPVQEIAAQTRDGAMRAPLLGINDWSQDQTTIVATRGTYNGQATATGSVTQVNTQIQSTISNVQSPLNSVVGCSALNGTLTQGDVITFAGVYGVNPVTKQTTGKLKQFVVAQAAASGATSVIVSPAMIGPQTAEASQNNEAQYQTVTALPADGAAITLFGNAGETYRRNFVYNSDAFTLAIVPLFSDLGKGVVDVGQETQDGVSLRTVTGYDVINDQTLTRLDILYGYALLRPEWATIVCDAL